MPRMHKDLRRMSVQQSIPDSRPGDEQQDDNVEPASLTLVTEDLLVVSGYSLNACTCSLLLLRGVCCRLVELSKMG